MARSTVITTVQRIRRQLDASVRHEYNRLGANIDADDTVITTDFEPQVSIRDGALLACESELMRVISVNRPAHEVTVIRGFQDSTATSHLDLAEVQISPRWTLFDIKDAMISEIESWSPRLFRVVNYQWDTVTDEDETIELPVELTNALGVVSLRRQWTEETESNAWPELPFRLMHGTVGTWDGATVSGMVIRMLPNLGQPRSGKVSALVTIPFDVSTAPLVDTEDLVEDYGLEQSMLEVVELGVKMRLLGDQEIGRSARNQQDEPRRAEEVPSGAALQTAQTIRSNYDRRFNQEVTKLRTKYPMVSW